MALLDTAFVVRGQSPAITGKVNRSSQRRGTDVPLNENGLFTAVCRTVGRNRYHKGDDQGET